MKTQFSFIVECQLIYVERVTEVTNHTLGTFTARADSWQKSLIKGESVGGGSIRNKPNMTRILPHKHQ
jgi:hypothetical protein